MAPSPDGSKHEMIRQFLHQELEHEAEEAFVERLAEDQELFEAVAAMEEELILDYLQGRMPPAEAARFEQHYLTTPERRSHVEQRAVMIRGLKRQRKASWWAQIWESGPFRMLWNVRAAAMAGGLASLFLLIYIVREPRPGPVGQVFFLDAGLTKSTQSAESAAGFRVQLRPGGGDIVFRMVEPAASEYANYRGVLRRMEGAETDPAGNVTARRIPEGLEFSIRLAAGTLASGDYILRVDGVGKEGQRQTLGSRYFRVE